MKIIGGLSTCILPTTLLLILISRVGYCQQQSSCSPTKRGSTSFHRIVALNCVSPVYQLQFPVGVDYAAGITGCAMRCRRDNKCRAFTLDSSGSRDFRYCRLFVFDACSSQPLLATGGCYGNKGGGSSVIYVKQTGGLEPGRLCPSDYRWSSGASGSAFKGSLYKLASNGTQASWKLHRDACRVQLAGGGDSTAAAPAVIVSKLADLNSLEEVADIRSSVGSSVNEFWVGALRSGSGSWIWSDCNRTLPMTRVDSQGLWLAGQPNEISVKTARVREIGGIYGLADVADSTALYGVCECVDPFVRI